MSKSYRPEPPDIVADDLDDDEEHEVVDVDYETFVYDDVDGHVIEPTPGGALPAPAIRLDDDDDDDEDGEPRRAIVSAGDTMPFAMSLDDRMADDAAGALLDRAVAQPKAVDETAGRPVTSDLTSVAAAASPRTSSGSKVASKAERPPSKIERKLVAARTPKATRAPLVARTELTGRTERIGRTEVESSTEVEAPMPAQRRSAAATAPVAAKADDDASPADAAAAEGRGVVCPFCAHVRAAADEPCPRCTMADTASTRRSTGERIGPWFVLQRKNPTAPGLRFSVLLKLARRGHVTAKSIVRGPTTGQLWRYASEVKGLSRVFGTCWHCRADLSPDATTCPKCKSTQEIPDDPDVFLENNAVPLMTDESTTTSPPPANVGTREHVVMREVEPAAVAAEPPPPRRAAPPSRPAPAAPPKPATVERPLAAAESSPRPIARIAANAGVKPSAVGPGGEPVLSASELAAVFQLAPTVKPGRTRRVGRRVWRATKFVVAVAAVVAISGAAILYFKPEWREPTRAWATPIALDARDRAIAAKDWTAHKSVDAWHATTAAIARWRAPAPTVDAPPPPQQPAADPNVATNDAAPTPVAPARTDDAPPAEKSPPRIAEGQPSIVDATPAKPATPDRARIAAQLDADQQTWESMMAARAATKPTAAAANVPAAATPTDAAKASVEADERSAELARTASAAIADAERALAQTRAENAPRPAAPQQSQPTPPQQAPSPAQPTPTAAATPAKPFTPTVTLDDALTRAVTLRQKAFDAQAAGNWSGAVQIYEEIEKLPADAQPSDLQVRLKLARERAKR